MGILRTTSRPSIPSFHRSLLVGACRAEIEASNLIMTAIPIPLPAIALLPAAVLRRIIDVPPAITINCVHTSWRPLHYHHSANNKTTEPTHDHHHPIPNNNTIRRTRR